MISFFVLGKPEPGGSKTGYLHPQTKRVLIVDANKNVAAWKKEVAATAVKFMKGLAVTKKALSVKFTFYVLRPKYHFGTGKNASLLKDASPKYPAVKPDALKLARAVEDALTGIVYWDDALIVREELSKEYADGDLDEGVLIEVTEID